MPDDVLRSEVDKPKMMPVREFKDGGYLQEVNRRLLHPLGLALEVGVLEEPGRWFTLRDQDVERLQRVADRIRHLDPDEAAAVDDLIERSTPIAAGDGILTGIWDCRDDPEGIIFGDGVIDPEKAHHVTDELNIRSLARVASLGYLIQDAGVPPAAED